MPFAANQQRELLHLQTRRRPGARHGREHRARRDRRLHAVTPAAPPVLHDLGLRALPVQSGGQGAIVNNTWQHWNATDATPGNGVWWSSKIAVGSR